MSWKEPTSGEKDMGKGVRGENEKEQAVTELVQVQALKHARNTRTAEIQYYYFWVRIRVRNQDTVRFRVVGGSGPECGPNLAGLEVRGGWLGVHNIEYTTGKLRADPNLNPI